VKKSMRKLAILYSILCGLLIAPRQCFAQDMLPLRSSAGPCDVLSQAGSPCVAAYSVTRRLTAAYGGKLFQLQRTSDSATQDIAPVNGVADTASIATFCNGTTCNFSKIYDQSGNGNDLVPQATANQAPFSTYVFNNGHSLPIVTTSCNSPCTINVAGYAFSQNYAKRPGVGIPTGSNSISIYYVRLNAQSDACCGDFGDVEATVVDNGAGHMFELAYTTLNGTPAKVGIDREDGIAIFSGTVPSVFTLIGKHSAADSTTTVKLGDATVGPLATLSGGSDPVTFYMEGGITLGTGGDGSPAPTNFLEGAIIASVTSDNTDDSLQSNITGFYGAQ
jgi:hypothetical protein